MQSWYPPSHMQHSPDPARPSTEGFHLEDSLPALEANPDYMPQHSWNQCLPFPLLIITYLQLSAGKIIETAVLPQTTTADDTRPFCLSHIHPRYIPSAQLMVIRYGISETPSA